MAGITAHVRDLITPNSFLSSIDRRRASGLVRALLLRQ